MSKIHHQLPTNIKHLRFTIDETSKLQSSPNSIKTKFTWSLRVRIDETINIVKSF